ncbi:class I SAM-dependent methyltransferase [Terrabacter sp. NPDC080008]|uniref:class I SAM-dependent methyltransferase n=1 Tax=Terrabacter sp. NPDC080008 TaxID=3155176 RepID=UPI00344F72DD
MVESTESASYAERLRSLSGAKWKRILPVQLPYQLNLKRQKLGRTLDIGCGIGRNLVSLSADSLGVDHNPHSIAEAKKAGFKAMTVEEFEASDEAKPASFDSLLIAHVLEHMDEESGRSLLRSYLPYLRPGGVVFVICPQEVGYRTDATHVRFVTDTDIEKLCREMGLTPRRSYSFPFPRFAGKFFPYNEFCVRATLDGTPS